jgi:hypothetical protein
MDTRRQSDILRPENDPTRATRLIIWADVYLKSAHRVEQCLRPELESGNVSPRDFESAKDFFSNNHRRYPVSYVTHFLR